MIDSIPSKFKQRASVYAQEIGATIVALRTYGVHFSRSGSKKVELISWYDLSRSLGYSPDESQYHEE